METCCLAKPMNQKANTIENTGKINLKCKNMKKYMYTLEKHGEKTTRKN